MIPTLNFDDFDDFRDEFPDRSPADLFDLAMDRLGSTMRWATAPWWTCSNWMDMFSTVSPHSCSYVLH